MLRRLHWRQLEQLRRRVKRKKMFLGNILPGKFDVIPDESNRAKLWKHRKMMLDHMKEMRIFYLPESMEVRHSCDREVMGYVTIGGCSFLRGEHIGIGYVTLPSPLKIIRKKSNIVLVRNTAELQYRFARLEILVDINRRYK
ncbi:hypothetical protein EAG_12855 [Camponotus floridanus]|uniref:POP1 C-terminal domain-containing protein n=1 Tax=Camponotus floridanus TaxID=104421 RepID=E2A1S7_CAMFO|nr:hypothetical protein EAG_12855 [Camponotus floridanus]